MRQARALPLSRADLGRRFLQGDAIVGLRTLPEKSVDHTMTDPPYEEHTHTKAIRHTGKKGDGEYKGTYKDDLGFDAITEAQRFDCAREIVRVTKGWGIVFCEDDALFLWRRALCSHHRDPANIERCLRCGERVPLPPPGAPFDKPALGQCPAGAKWRRNGIWRKTNAMPKLHGDCPAQGTEHFVIVWCGDGHSVWNRGGRHNVWDYAKEHSKIHKTRKPLALMQDLVLSFSRPGDLICDPFAGSASTLVAAKTTGRLWLGWELREKVHRLASVDLEKAREQLAFFENLFRPDSTIRPGAFISDDDANKRQNMQTSMTELFT